LNYWVFSVAPENWKIAREQKIWAVRTKNLTKKVKKGDCIALYIVGTRSFCTIIQISEDWTRSSQIVWADEIEKRLVKYPYQAKVRIAQEGLASVKDLLPKLTFIKNKRLWGPYFLGTPANFERPIEENDYDAICEALKSNPLPQDITSLLKVKPRKQQIIPKEGKKAKP
jgi:predicted RNA-binding protein